MQNKKQVLRRLILKGLGTSVLQVLLYLLLLYTGSLLADYLDKPTHKDVSWGLTLYFSLVLFAATVFVLNTATALVNKAWFTGTALALTAIFYIIGWGEDFNMIPYRTIYLIAIGLTCLLAKLPIDQMLEKLNNRHYTWKEL
jgi:DMSO/TMAO reductase YedYZ heme-binding membrane subunit